MKCEQCLLHSKQLFQHNNKPFPRNRKPNPSPLIHASQRLTYLLPPQDRSNLFLLLNPITFRIPTRNPRLPCFQIVSGPRPPPIHGASLRGYPLLTTGHLVLTVNHTRTIDTATMKTVILVRVLLLWTQLQAPTWMIHLSCLHHLQNKFDLHRTYHRFETSSRWHQWQDPLPPHHLLASDSQTRLPLRQKAYHKVNLLHPHHPMFVSFANI